MANSLSTAATPDNVAGTATKRGVLNSSDLNLLGLFGTSGDMQALVRMPGGRVKTVKPGNRLARSKILSIDADGVVLRKGSTTTRIKMPEG